MSPRATGLSSFVSLALALTALIAPAFAGDVEPSLSLPAPADKTVALTFDACMGQTDRRILDELVAEQIPATLFVTHRWIERNAEAIAVIEAHPDLFEIENHGDEHVPAVTDRSFVFGLKTAGSLDNVTSEVQGGDAAIATTFGHHAVWFRGATARYSKDAMSLIGQLGFRIAGYSLNADIGASLPEKQVARRMAAARTGDVIIAHINQPKRDAGAGVVDGIKALEAKGFHFVRLDQAFTPGPTG
ncbi:polysaccharide deacetylase family protein [Oryzibacter oryziterrae]|uniref:polysaccharide deacetylase family protein n=1 Tax=Oryzibacter oryziterrae TaxID=2766474 RepID=UPI0028BD9815|nr:polysaccharide deacetylase family protein [Oryzibacter oryziterrae]